MKGMKSAQEFGETPPQGRYKVRLEKVDAGFSKSKGNPQLNILAEITEPAQFAGRQIYDNVITDGTVAGKHVTKIRQLLGARADTDEEIPDAVLASELLGLELFADVGHEARMQKGPSGRYDVPVTEVINGKAVPVMNLKIHAYYRHGTGGVAAAGVATNAGATALPAAPTFAPAPQQFVQPQFTPPTFQQPVPNAGAPAVQHLNGPQVVPHNPMTIVDQSTQHAPPAAPAQFTAPPGWALVNGQWVQQNTAPAGFPQGMPPAATTPWGTNGAPPGGQQIDPALAAHEAEKTSKRGRKGAQQ